MKYLFVGMLMLLGFNTETKAQKHSYEAETATIIGNSATINDSKSSGGFLISLSRQGDGIQFFNLPSANKLAIRYASLSVGTISVRVNNQPPRKVNIHSSGALKGSFLYSVVDISIKNHESLTIIIDDKDSSVNIDKIMVGKGNLGLPPDIWNLPDLPIAKGCYPADWNGLSRLYSVPDWWREAKFGAWAHWDPQSMPENGDWYARNMYLPDDRSKDYEFHVNKFGHPSEYGYKDICHNWVIDKWNPDELMDLFVEMGAHYFMAMGVHHDNFDCWNSTYQPWNAVNVGPKQDIVGIWEKVARKHGMRFGIGFHNSPGRTWGQFMSVRYTSDKSGPKQGVSYDALQTVMDGKGKWWEGMDPVDLYGPKHDKNDPLHSPFANQFMWRVDDAITKYHPDVIYFDEHAGNSLVDLGVNMGLGFLAPSLVANYYNQSMQWNHGKMDVVINLKGVGGKYNSFKNNQELIPLVDRSLVKSTEAVIESQIAAYPFQTETSIAAWHYRTGQKYMSAKEVIGQLMQNVSRNGTMLLNITQHGRGNLDSLLTRICKDIGAWLKVNGDAVYGSRPFEVSGEKDVEYTRNHGKTYATLLNWEGNSVLLPALHCGGTTIGKVSKVELLGSDIPIQFVQDENGLKLIPTSVVQPLSGIADKTLASKCRVFRITHDKDWVNDNDPGTIAKGWYRKCNLGTGDYNNDLTISDKLGDVWSSIFTGTSVKVIAPKESGAGKIAIQVDGRPYETVDLSVNGTRIPQQVVSEIKGLKLGKHTIAIINKGSGTVAIDALIVR